MKKEMIIFTSTSWDNDEFNECWAVCSSFNEECFDSVTKKENEIAYRTGDFLLSIMDGNEYYNKVDWDYPKLQEKIKSLMRNIENSETKVHLLLHSDDDHHLAKLKSRFDEQTGVHIYSSATGDLWDYLVPLSKPCEPNEIDATLVKLWERLENPPVDTDLKKPKDPMFALRHNLAKSKRLVREFSEHCIRHHPEGLTPSLVEKIMSRLEKSKASFNDCLEKEFLLTVTNENVNKVYQYFGEIEERALKIKTTGLKVTKKINMGFHCADNFSKILDIINEANDG